jgi:hypothetical protein
MSTEEKEQTSEHDTSESSGENEKPESSGENEKPELSDEGKEEVKQMREAYDDDRPTAVLPGTDNTITGVAVNEWLDDDGNPKFGKDEEQNKDREGDSDEHQSKNRDVDSDEHQDEHQKNAD